MADLRKNDNKKADAYRPGMYSETMPKIHAIIESAFLEWKTEKNHVMKDLPVICISRKIGVGSFEIAELVARKIHYRVYDREILEFLINTKKVAPSIRDFLDERSPSGFETLLSKILGDMVFKNEYAKLLFKTIFTIVNLGPSIFVGRGAHLILPRGRILAVRLTCSNDYRNQRLARMLSISEIAASLRLAHLDIEQKNFFKNVYGLKSVAMREFDMVLNMDYLKNPNVAADIIASAFESKFGDKLPLESRMTP